MSERTLVILRHAKAEHPPGLADLDRPLTQRGHADAGAAGAWLAARGYRPGLVLCSPAKRTRQTWHGVSLALAGTPEPKVRYEPVLYYESPRDALDLIRKVPGKVSTVLLVGHNPAVSVLSALLDRDAGRDSDGLRTSGIAVHVHDGEWTGYGPGAAPLSATHTGRA